MGELQKKFVEVKDDDSPASNPTQCLSHLLMSKDMADLTVIIPGHSENFKVHRLVLSMWSQVFQAMLFGPMAEGDSITLMEDNPEAFSWLLNYMYAGQTELPSIELALHVYNLANKYLMRHLKNVCSEYLIDNVTAVSVPEILNIATLLEDETLINRCEEVLENSADSFFTSPTIGSLNSDSLGQLLMKDLPVSSEAVIFQGILNWGKSQLKYKEKEITTLTLRQEVENFLPKIRFLSMSCEEFVKHVLPDTILTFNEIQALQLNIAGVSEVTVPDLFSTTKDERAKFHISKLRKCHIRKGKLIAYSSEMNNSTAVILDNVHINNVIYLSKLEFEVAINNIGTLTIKDSSEKELKVVQFNGKRAEFDEPLQMLPEETYIFVLTGVIQCIGRQRFFYTIKPNGLVFGNMMNGFSTPCVLHYWKRF